VVEIAAASSDASCANGANVFHFLWEVLDHTVFLVPVLLAVIWYHIPVQVLPPVKLRVACTVAVHVTA
jgi:hypothetical protein